MLTINIAFDVTALTLSAAAVLGLLVHWGLSKQRERRREKLRGRIVEAVHEYFANSGVQVAASCFPVLQDQRYVAMVESEPLKRFRYSHIIEQAVIQHVEKTTGAQVERVYWRFPLQRRPEAGHLSTDDGGPGRESGDYNVGDESWEHYETALAQHRTPRREPDREAVHEAKVTF